MEKLKDENLRKLLEELSDSLCRIYGDKLKMIFLYGSAARGTQTEDSDIDIMVLVDADNDELRSYNEKLCDASTDISLKYIKVLSVLDVSYKEYIEWVDTSPFYKNIAKEGVVLYAA